ncbi:hypothetical protein T492DRAFT_121427 [Pavlovales sp. CCMP2436]|nr:hypothetical protein T492DRAFT_121427 [Pavlovales sp. CCMP2436]
MGATASTHPGRGGDPLRGGDIPGSTAAELEVSLPRVDGACIRPGCKLSRLGRIAAGTWRCATPACADRCGGAHEACFQHCKAGGRTQFLQAYFRGVALAASVYFCIPAREPRGCAVSASLCAACVERARKATSCELSTKEEESGLDASLALEARRRVKAIKTLRIVESDVEIAERMVFSYSLDRRKQLGCFLRDEVVGWEVVGAEVEEDDDDRFDMLDRRRAAWRHGDDASGAGRLVEALLSAVGRGLLLASTESSFPGWRPASQFTSAGARRSCAAGV